jgi:SAM-dependent methyltransferase
MPERYGESCEVGRLSGWRRRLAEGVIVNAWEQRTDEGKVRALAGHSSCEEIRADRVRRAGELITSLSIGPDKVGFEIGSGNGVVAGVLASRCLRLDCSDISATFLQLAQAECAGHANVRFFRIEGDYLAQLPSDSYDFGYSLNVFIHFNPFDIYHYLVDVCRLLKPGGVFCFDACTFGSQTRDKFIEHASLYRKDPASVRGFLAFNDPEIICRLIEEVGLTIKSGARDNREGWLHFVVGR